MVGLCLSSLVEGDPRSAEASLPACGESLTGRPLGVSSARAFRPSTALERASSLPKHDIPFPDFTDP